MTDNEMKEMASIKMQQKSEFTVLTDIVKFPSKGVFYPDGRDSCNVEYMIHKDEQILQTPGLIEDGTAFDVLLRRKIKDKDLNIDDLLVGDKNKILMFLRITAYGPDYEVKILSPYKNEEFETSVDLSKIMTNEKKFVKPDDSLEFSFTTKLTKKSLKFKLLTSKQEADITKTVESKLAYTKIDETLTERMKSQIVELDGNRDKNRISNFVDTMPPMDAKQLRNYINEVEPGLDMEYEFHCPFTGRVFQTWVPISAKFFYPESRI